MRIAIALLLTLRVGFAFADQRWGDKCVAAGAWTETAADLAGASTRCSSLHWPTRQPTRQTSPTRPRRPGPRSGSGPDPGQIQVTFWRKSLKINECSDCSDL